MSATELMWKGLYKIGGISALIFVVYALATMVIFFGIGGAPENVADLFEFMQENRIMALLRLDILTLLVVPLYYPIYLCICLALINNKTPYVILGALLAFAGLTILLTTPSLIPLLSLSEKYAATSSAVQREQLLAAGEAILAGRADAKIGGFIMLIGSLILNVLMISSDQFGKTTAYVGVLTLSLDLTANIVSFFSPGVYQILMMFAGTLYIFWLPMLARDLLRLGRDDPEIMEVS